MDLINTFGQAYASSIVGLSLVGIIFAVIQIFISDDDSKKKSKTLLAIMLALCFPAILAASTLIFNFFIPSNAMDKMYLLWSNVLKIEAGAIVAGIIVHWTLSLTCIIKYISGYELSEKPWTLTTIKVFLMILIEMLLMLVPFICFMHLIANDIYDSFWPALPCATIALMYGGAGVIGKFLSAGYKKAESIRTIANIRLVMAIMSGVYILVIVILQF